MGVRGLTSYCRQNEAKTSAEVPDLYDVTLAVDFVGYLYHLCKELFKESTASSSWLLLGGCTLRLERYVDAWIECLYERKIRLIFITDPPLCFGGDNHRKGYCLADRALQKAEQIKQLAQKLEETLSLESDESSRVIAQNSMENTARRSFQRNSIIAKTLLQTNGRFPFAREKLRGVLRKHGIKIQTATREADEELGHLVQSGEAFAVLAEDSDFLIMSGVKYIPFEKLRIEHDQQLQVRARVFSPNLVAASLGLEVEQLVDLAILCGNDLTSLLDTDYNMATEFDFPVQRIQGSLYPADAAEWIREHMPMLENPFLKCLETKKTGFLRALFEIYRFYGYGASFSRKFPMKIESILPAKKLKLYKKLIDHYDYPPMAIDILETEACGLSHRFDALASIPGFDEKCLDGMHAPARRLSYLVLGKSVIEEWTGTNCVQVQVAPLKFLHPFLSIPIQGRSANRVELMFSSLMFVLLYEDPSGGTPKVGQLANMLGKKDKQGIAVKNIVFALLVLWKQDRLYLKHSSLLDDRLLELLLLSSLISMAVDLSKQKPADRDSVKFDEQSMNMEIYAVVSSFLEALKQLHHLRPLLGSSSLECTTYFSGEVFIRVCHTLMQREKNSAQKNNENLSRREVAQATDLFDEITDKNSFRSHFTYVCATMQRMKALILLPVDVVHINVHSKSAASAALEHAMQSKGYNLSSTNNPKLLPVTAKAPPAATLPQPPASLFNFRLPVSPKKDSFHLNASAPAFNAQSVKGLMPSSVAKRIGTDSAVRDGSAYVVENKKESTKTVSLKGIMKTLPVFAHRDEILKNVKANQLTIIQGETGCGKSTSVPQFLYDSWARSNATSERPVNIYVTQPRRIAAIELANTVAKMREGNEFKEDGIVGKVIGYRIGQKQMISSETKITYVTTGYMVERIIHDPEALMKITHLVLDEVHERSMDVDLLLLLLKLQLKDHSHLRLVIMSATMDAQVLIKYLQKALSTNLVSKKPLFVGSKRYPVENVYLDTLSDWFPGLWRRRQKELVLMKDQFHVLSQSRLKASSQMAKKAIVKIHEKQMTLIQEMVLLLIEGQSYQAGPQSQCILIFLPGIGSINALYDSLSPLAARGQNVQVMVLHSGIELEHQQEAFKLLSGKSTKIILATNIAESSVTIPDVTHVINCAIEKQIEMPNAGCSHAEVLVDTWCSRASALQRAGRAGRVMPGMAFHLFTEAFRDLCMADYNTPELLRKPLDRIVLQLKGQLKDFGVPSILLQQALDAPDLSHIDGAYKLLAAFNAIDSTEEEHSRLTKFGSFVCHLPLSLELCRLLMTGTYLVQDVTSTNGSWPLLFNIVILVAILSVPDLFVMPSFYHVQSVQLYVNEMKKNLQAKLELDGGMWSEPLSIWLFYMKTMSEQRVDVKRSLNSTFRKMCISARRFQTLNFLISDLCARLVALSKSKTGDFKQLLDTKAIIMLSKLDAYASSQRMDKELLAYAQDAVAHKQNEVCILRFLIIQNYGEHLIGSTREKPSKFADDDLEGNDRVDLTINKDDAANFNILSNRDKATLFNQLAGSADPMDELAALAHDKNIVSIYSYATPRHQTEDKKECFSEFTKDTVERMSFPVSLVYYIRGEKFPINLSIRHSPHEREQGFKFRVAGSNSCNLSWKQQRDNVKASTGSRSLFSLPIRSLTTQMKKGSPEPKLLAVYADRLFTGDETRMWCTNCTLLPPTSMCYYAIMLLVTARTHTNIQLLVDATAGGILHVKVGAQDAIFPRKMALKVTVLLTINAVRTALSDALNASVGAKRVCVTDLLALSDDNIFMMESKANAQQCKWQRLAITETDKVFRGQGETPACFPELFLI
ncbi:hypothetical protein CCR75_003684 [Bremia lactucae]|uniref:Uncharacterized protein n=1 Tax=Bremia lactucae TaxID=4779 RepID=A0A976NYN3_BRELC|nr:hypothetical protein CCR75_003684 [Bremia lactucae]